MYKPNKINTKNGMIYSLQSKGLITNRITHTTGSNIIFKGENNMLITKNKLDLKIKFLHVSFLKILKNCSKAKTTNKFPIAGKME